VTGVERVVLDAAFAALCLVVAVETIVLLDVLRMTVRLRAEVYEAMPELARQEHLAGGTFVDFEAPDLAGGGTLRSADLGGATTALLFIRRDESEGPSAGWLLDTVAGLRHRGEGRLLVLCDGSRPACSELSSLVGPDVPVLHDEEGRIRGRYLVTATPAAVLLDSEARVAQYGTPDRVPDREEEAI
jgi:hypothetical protein